MFELFVIHATLSDPTVVHHTCCPKPGPQVCLADFTNDASIFFCSLSLDSASHASGPVSCIDIAGAMYAIQC